VRNLAQKKMTLSKLWSVSPLHQVSEFTQCTVINFVMQSMMLLGRTSDVCCLPKPIVSDDVPCCLCFKFQMLLFSLIDIVLFGGAVTSRSKEKTFANGLDMFLAQTILSVSCGTQQAAVL
jgi:hypothetical protein